MLDPGAGVVGDVEAGILHAERIEQPFLLELIERFAGHDLDDAAEHVGRLAVVPGGAGLKGQRQFRQPLGSHLGDRTGD